MDLKIKLFLTQLCVSLINFVRNTFNLLKNKIIGVFNAFKYVVKYLIKFNYHLICLKVLCFSLLTYNAVLVSIDYFEYPYIEKHCNFNVKNGSSGHWTLGVFNDIVTKIVKMFQSSRNY